MIMISLGFHFNNMSNRSMMKHQRINFKINKNLINWIIKKTLFLLKRTKK